jgi:fructose/tagatose bisphosphate aldolase
MNQDGPAACFTVHSLDHLRAALTAGAERGLPVVALSAAGASGFAGAGWFASVVTQGRAEFPGVPLTAILDCGDRAGDAIAALNRGLPHLIFTGHPTAAERLANIAAQCGAAILTTRPASCDLINVSDPYHTARTHCASLEGSL